MIFFFIFPALFNALNRVCVFHIILNCAGWRRLKAAFTQIFTRFICAMVFTLIVVQTIQMPEKIGCIFRQWAWKLFVSTSWGGPFSVLPLPTMGPQPLLLSILSKNSNERKSLQSFSFQPLLPVWSFLDANRLDTEDERVERESSVHVCFNLLDEIFN